MSQFLPLKIKFIAGWWWYMPFIPALMKQRQANFYEFQDSLVYKEKPYLEKKERGLERWLRG